MTTREAVDTTKAIIERREHYYRTLTVMHWDHSTLDGACSNAAGDRSATMGFLSGEAFKLSVSKEMKECLDILEADIGALSETEAAMYRVLRRSYNKDFAVPPEEVAELERLTGESEAAWMAAKSKGDYETMKPYFEKIFAFQRKLSNYYGTYNHIYDGLLDDYEEDMTVQTLDTFFSALREEIAPLLERITACGREPDTSFLKKSYDIRCQQLLVRSLTELIGLDMKRLCIGEAEHPYMTSVTADDVRYATHYYEKNVLSAIYSSVHEGGHALYDQGVSRTLQPFGLRNGASMGFHESQSRFFENMIARSRPFMRHLLPRMQALFPNEMCGVTEDMLYRAVNVVKPSLVRIEADELTYCLHICVRYELEKLICEDKVDLNKLPELWSNKYQELLGVCPQGNAEGVLQDTHWPSGLFGYFPTYAIGNAYAAQIYHAMDQEINVEKRIWDGDFAAINDWLRKHVHEKGMLKKPAELLLEATGEPLNTKYFTDYLVKKYSEIYNLQR